MVYVFFKILVLKKILLKLLLNSSPQVFKCISIYNIKYNISNVPTVSKSIYGELFDVKVDKNPINIAYSSVPLGFKIFLIKLKL